MPTTLNLSTSDIRTRNRLSILRAVRQSVQLTRLQICEITGLTAAGVSRIVRELINAGFLREGERLDGGGGAGRKEVALHLNSSDFRLLAITLTANRIAVSLVDISGKSIAFQRYPTKNLAAPEVLIKDICRTANSMIKNNGLANSNILGVAVIVAAKEDEIIDGVVNSVSLNWNNVPVSSLVESQLKLPVHLVPRANALLEAECQRGLDIGASDVVLANVGLGIGACAQINGQIVSGGSCNIAHLALTSSPDTCKCGRTGCLEVGASGYTITTRIRSHPHLEKFAKASLPGEILTAAIRLAEQGDPIAQRIFFEAGQEMAKGLDVIGAILSPQRIILAGETGRQEKYVEGVRNALSAIQITGTTFELRVSQVTSMAAAIQSGLNYFVFSENLDKALTQGQRSVA